MFIEKLEYDEENQANADKEDKSYIETTVMGNIQLLIARLLT